MKKDPGPLCPFQVPAFFPGPKYFEGGKGDGGGGGNMEEKPADPFKKCLLEH